MVERRDGRPHDAEPAQVSGRPPRLSHEELARAQAETLAAPRRSGSIWLPIWACGSTGVTRAETESGSLSCRLNGWAAIGREEGLAWRMALNRSCNEGID